MRIPLRRIFDEKRRLAIPVLAALALNIALYALVVYPLGVRVRNTELRQQAAAQELLVAQRDDAAAQGIVAGRDRTDSALQAFYKDVLPRGLGSARDITYLRLAQLAEQHGIQINRRNAETATNPQGSLARLRITMSLEGNYESIRRFIYQLESGTDFVVIDSVALAQDAQAGSGLTLTLGLSTYYQAEPHGA
jgi:Tfp pilus assembly protein PilO